MQNVVTFAIVNLRKERNLKDKRQTIPVKTIVVAVIAVLSVFSSVVLAEYPKTGYWIPAEFAPQEAMWIQWPDFRQPPILRNYDPRIGWYHDPQPYVDIFVEYVRALQTEGTVKIIVRDALGEELARGNLTQADVPLVNVMFHQLPYDDVWALDNFGPFVVKDGKLHLLNFGFDAWNDPDYGPYERDDDVPLEVAKQLHIKVTSVTYVDPTDGTTKPLIFEGGAFESSGEGTIVASWSIIVDRNPHLDQPQATQIFKEITGAHTVIWIENSNAESVGLPYGFSAWDHTDGYMKFYAPGKVAVIRTTWAQSSAMIAEARTKLQAAGWTITDFSADWNFMNHVVFGNKVIAVYGRGSPRMPGETTASNVQKGRMELQKLYPDKEIVIFDGSTLLFLCGGGIHCITRWQPVV
jgi:agmatine/peptidylarginine deiminase